MVVRLRTCASCEWIFQDASKHPECPKCGFATYGARYVYGNKCYQYAKTQKPWRDKKLTTLEIKLDKEITNNRKEYYNGERFADLRKLWS